MIAPFMSGFLSRLRALVLCLASPLVEKNMLKRLAVDAPVVLSMARLVVLGFAVALFHRIWSAGIAGWPDVSVAIATLLALPIVDALAHARPNDVLSLLRAIAESVTAIGGNSASTTLPGTEPSKFDDHRQDGPSDGDRVGGVQ